MDFEPVGKRVRVAGGTTLLEAARQAGLPLTTECGGSGSCGQCRVIVREQAGPLSTPGIVEEDLLDPVERDAGFRLACQARVEADVKVDVPRASLVADQRLQVEAWDGTRAIPGSIEDRVVRAFDVSVPAPSLADPRGDLDRALDSLEAAHGLQNLAASPETVRALPNLLRENRWLVAVVVHGGEITGFLAPGARLLGMAVDLGTTKIAAYLVDLASGETLAADGVPNPQIGYGEDVISRIAYATRQPGGRRELAQAVRAALAELAGELSARAGLSPGEIGEYCIAGNTAMTHLLLELPVAQLASAPYVPASSGALETRARDLGLPGPAEAHVYIPPCVAGFVGADHVAMIVAGDLDRLDRNVLGIDIGTNTEIVLARRDQECLTCLSCASGPAFEGAHIQAGMRAASGAIERVRLDNGRVSVQTVGGGPPVGICGSGILDAVAELRQAGTLNSRGRFLADAPGVRSRKRAGHDGNFSSLEYLLVPASETGSGEEIAITQGDIVEIQMAKGAIRAGIAVLLEETGTPLDALDEVVLAGAFGTHLNLESAIRIGLLPDLPRERFHQVGNAAGEGARMMLVSRAARARAVEISRKVDYIELAGHPGFKRNYARAMLFSG